MLLGLPCLKIPREWKYRLIRSKLGMLALRFPDISLLWSGKERGSSLNHSL